MEKTARKPSTDPLQERLRQDKANWNKEVSTFVNDLIHFKKTMNGWPSKFFKERSRIVDPIPADPATIIGSLANDFQELANKGNSIIQEQINYAKTRRKKQPKQLPLPFPKPNAPTAPTAPAPTEAKPAPDLSKQLELGLASNEKNELIKLATELESKYYLESQASNPFTRFITRLFNPKFGFGEGARIRRLRMTMLDNCAKSYKALKQLQKEVVKSSKESIVTSHKMMTSVFNYWNIVNRLFSTYQLVKPGEVKDQGGKIEDEELKREKAVEEGREPEPEIAAPISDPFVQQIRDYKAAANYLGSISASPALRELNSVIESILAAPKSKKTEVMRQSNVAAVYDKALKEVNAELGTNATSFVQLVEQAKNKPVAKEAQLQRYIGKARHQLLPGATSGPRLEIYGLIDKLRANLDGVMNLLEDGFDQEKLSPAIAEVNRDMTSLRTMVRSLYYSEKPGEASSPFF